MNREECLFYIEEKFEALLQRYICDEAELEKKEDDIRDYCYDLAEAVIEDIEVKEMSITAYNNALNNGKNDVNFFLGIGNETYDSEVYKTLNEFKTWYIRDENKMREFFENGEECLSNSFECEFLKLVYPVFVMEILNVESTKESKNINNYALPLSDRCELDNYLFMLLIAYRKQSAKGVTIWGEVENRYKKIKEYKKKNSCSACDEKEYKKILEWFDFQHMKRKTDKTEYIEHIKELLRMNPKLVEEGVLRTEINSIIKLLSCYESIEISKSMFIYMLNRLTGWIDLYIFCRINLLDKLEWAGDDWQIQIINRMDNRLAFCYQLSENENGGFRDKISSRIKEILVTPPISDFFVNEINRIYRCADDMYKYQNKKVGDSIYRKIYKELIETKENRILDSISNFDAAVFGSLYK